MALYAIGDRHLSRGTDKPMEVFVGAWKNYLQKLERGLSCIGPADTTVLLEMCIRDRLRSHRRRPWLPPWGSPGPYNRPA